eukprot:5345293-Amphidinium_carterae.1
MINKTVKIEQFDNQNEVLVSQTGFVHLLSLSLRSVSYLRFVMYGLRGGGPAAKLALATIRLHLCSALARLGKRVQMLSESEVALREVDEVPLPHLRTPQTHAPKHRTPQKIQK